MDEKLREHIEGLFYDAPRNRKTIELKEEMLQNTSEKYSDLLQEGKSEDEAYCIAVSGIGDVRGLVAELIREDETPSVGYMEKEQQKSASLTAIAVMVYILSLVPIILGTVFYWNSGIIFLLFLVFVAAATGLLVYNSQTKPKYIRADDSVVEEFKEWQSGKDDTKRVRKSISAALWSVILAVYLIVSMFSMAWHITWIIFPIGVAAEALINIYFSVKK